MRTCPTAGNLAQSRLQLQPQLPGVLSCLCRRWWHQVSCGDSCRWWMEVALPVLREQMGVGHGGGYLLLHFQGELAQHLHVHPGRGQTCGPPASPGTPKNGTSICDVPRSRAYGSWYNW